MRVIKTLNSVYEVERTADGERIRRTEPHPANRHALADGEWHDLGVIQTNYPYANYIFLLSDGRSVITSGVVSDDEVEKV